MSSFSDGAPSRGSLVKGGNEAIIKTIDGIQSRMSLKAVMRRSFNF